jgi:ribosome maturation factor RimP
VSRKEVIEERAWELLKGLCSEQGLIPVDAEYAKVGGEYNLLIYIDKEDGVGIDDCETLSRAMDPLLDQEDFIPDAYTLIVSSPGLGRQLRRPRDYEFAMGKELEIHTYRAMNGEKEFYGTMTAYDDDTVTVTSDGTETVFNRAEISNIRLAFDF